MFIKSISKIALVTPKKRYGDIKIRPLHGTLHPVFIDLSAWNHALCLNVSGSRRVYNIVIYEYIFIIVT